MPARDARNAGASGAGSRLPTAFGSSASATAMYHAMTPSITDFCVHPSKLYLLLTAVLPGKDSPQLYVWDIFQGQLLTQTSLFGSALITSLAPLRPSISCDISGGYVFCTSTPAWVGAYDELNRDPSKNPAAAQVTDSVITSTANSYNRSFGSSAGGGGFGALKARASSGNDKKNAFLPPVASLLCVLDFRTGALLHQMSLDCCAMSIGNYCTKLQDPTQLYLGAHDGSISIWAPPDNIRSHIKHVLKESAKEYAKFRRNTPLNYTNEALNLEEAVETHWFQTQRHSMRWSQWAKREALDGGLAQGSV